MNNDELLRQIADHTSDPSFVLGLSALPNPDAVLRKAGLNHQVYDQVLGDPHVMSKVVDRRAGLLRREWQVEAGDDSPGAKKAAELCQLVLANLAEHEEFPLENSLGCLQEAALRGHRALEVVWKYWPNHGWVPDFLRDIPGRRLIHTGKEWRLLTLDNPSLGMPFPEQKVLMATHMATTDNPYGEALLSRCYWPYMFKHSGLTWWVTLAEKYGLPWVIATLGGATEESQRRELRDALVAMVADAIAVVPKDATVKLENLQGVNADVHERLVRISNGEISKVLVGQNLSTEIDQGAGARASSETGSELRDEIVESDGKLVARVMNRLFAWITERNFGPDVVPPTYNWIDEDKPPTAWADVVEKATKALPAKVPLRWAYDKLGIGEEYRDDKEMVAQRPEGKGKKTEDSTFSLGNKQEFTPEQQALEKLTEKSIAEGVKALAGNEEMILATVLASDSYEDAMERLLELYPALEVDGLEDALTRALLSAEAFGHYTVQEETK